MPFWALDVADVLRDVRSDLRGLSARQARDRLRRFGENRLPRPRWGGPLRFLGRQLESPLFLMLAGAAAVSMLVADTVDAGIILGILGLSALVGFWQEYSADSAVQVLLRRAAVRATVLRNGEETQVPVEEIVPGDVVLLRAGSLVPADMRILSSRTLYVNQASLTGETFPSEKSSEPVAADAPLGERSSALFAGSDVLSGSASAVVVATGRESRLGDLAASLRRAPPIPDFQRGLQHFGFMLLRVTITLLVLILAASLSLGHPVLEALLFVLALAVGMTPEMLPAIVAINLGRGAKQMARSGAIVKRLPSIENFGSMSVLCSDKTGTLTEGRVELIGWFGPDGERSEEVIRAAALNAALQRGLPSPIDETIRAHHPVDLTGYRKRDEVPYDFLRRRLSVLAEGPDGRVRMITKGALTSVIGVCSQARLPGDRRVPMDDVRARAEALFEDWSEKGLRVLGVAEKELPEARGVGVSDETGLTFLGYLTLSDVPKAGVQEAIADLHCLQVALKVITGDNRRVAVALAGRVGIPSPVVMTSEDLRGLSSEALARRTSHADVFAEIEPGQKERIILSLQRAGHVVGYIGDGINDAPALHAADVGISVEGAADVARQAADIVLLERDLGILGEAVRMGRSTMLNTLKYIFITMSANFGNMLSMGIAVLFLPFLPQLPKQILLNNFLSDFPAMTLGSDRVDPEATARPGHWDIRLIRNFMIVFGAISSVFDLITFAALLLVYHAGATEFRSAWFVVSLLTEVCILLVMRTRRPLLRSVPSRVLVVSCLVTAFGGTALPYLPWVRGLLGFTPLPPTLLGACLAITFGYVAVSEVGKRWFFERRLPWRPSPNG